MPKNAAWPKDSSPTQPIIRLKAQANSAMHSTRIRNTGYSTKGAATISTIITRKAIDCAREKPSHPACARGGANRTGEDAAVWEAGAVEEAELWDISGGLSKQATRPGQENDHHHHEYDGCGSLGPEHLG